MTENVNPKPFNISRLKCQRRKCQTPSKRRTDGRTVCPSLRLLDGVWNERTDKHARQQRPPRSPPSRRVDVTATRRPCQDTNGRTDGQTPGIEFRAL